MLGQCAAQRHCKRRGHELLGRNLYFQRWPGTGESLRHDQFEGNSDRCGKPVSCPGAMLGGSEFQRRLQWADESQLGVAESSMVGLAVPKSKPDKWRKFQRPNK